MLELGCGVCLEDQFLSRQDPAAEWTLDERDMHYAVGWSPYQGRRVRGRVVSTWLRGNCVHANGDVTAEPGTGRFVRLQ